MTSLLRNIASDLVDKKLWPVAVALLVALAAVPFLLGGGGDDAADAPLPVAIVPEGGTADAGVTLAEGVTGSGVDAKRNDPFRARGTTKPADATTTSSPTGVATSGGSTGAGTAASVPGLRDVDPVPVQGTGGTSTTPKTPATTNIDTWHVDLRFGRDGKLSSRGDVPRLSPLPSSEDPFFVFLGVAADGKTALFLVSSDADVTGDGKCLPSTTNCERVEMEAGDTQFFDVATPEGRVVQYQLDLVRISRKKAASAAVASAARARESAAGRTVLRKAVETKQVDVSDLAYSEELGLVVPTGARQDSGTLFGGYRVDLRFGSPDALVKRYNLARLTPLPSVDSPTFVYLGVLADGKTVLFLNPSEAAAAGDAVCAPSPEECQRVTLQAGQSATFAAPAIDGSTTEYRLDIDAITALQGSTAPEAAASRTRESPAGRVILRRLINEVGTLVGDLTFSGAAGVLQSTPPELPAAPADAGVQAAPSTP